MKRLGVPSLILLFSLSILSAPEALHAAIKIGYIDSEILRERMPEFQQIERELERLKQQYEQEAMDRQSKLIKLQEDFQKQELLLSDAKKAEMQVEFEEAVRQLQEFTQEKLGPNGEIFRKNIELSSPVFEKVNTALEELAEEESYDFIFDVASNGAIVYADPERYNVTEALLEKLEEAREAQEAGQ
ncbi:MAG: hypothetical protein CME13_04115 [Gemmatimonadetes bacterium]|jgi:outer membrane protein|uniref:Outer membrane protein n=2 Tax=root TaxID=1 RepID=E0XYF2_9BACT|nr:hypothetical protein [uncultured bacterium HF0500_16O16]MBD06125.1 hypothetical protein [Gemmatimonadota bacterium]MDP7361792.1 OmpH family outer membrane protein [Candidatus Latescibacterota bacterium]MBU07146.1 hypothetical protein [Gemmatimonadota bacterium]MDP7634685.1 OmpH family outer membrane protein [Candidatus Latescibacterota bacterium]|tara:strand:- start:341 stop:901 length:561 start_codon:yes stop_codon:yes gene_type:complete